MGKVTGFLELPRAPQPKREVADRLKDWQEVSLLRDATKSAEQAARCMDCGIPFCQKGCPLRNIIPEWNDLVYRQNWRAAYERLDATNNFPEFTGRLCPAPCEAACTLAIAPTEAPVTIEHIEMEIIERAFEEGWVVARPPTSESGRSVAVVGSGPAGLAAAQQLRRAGHRTVVFEGSDRPGGLLRYGIPDFKMEKAPLDRRLALLEAEGVEFRCGVTVGTDIPWPELRRDYDAVLIAIGAQQDRKLGVPGTDLEGVCTAMEFLTRQNRLVAGLPDVDGSLSAKGKRVIILGGGDTGSDCYGTSLRQGAKDVLQIELLPAPPTSRAPNNPWPEWPFIFRTSTSHQEGGKREFALMSERVVGEGNKVTGLEVQPVRMDDIGDGRKRPVANGEPTQTLAADLIIVAIGFTGPMLRGADTALGLTINARTAISVDDHYQTGIDGVFATGDAQRGASLIVWALADGRKSAAAVDDYLSGL